MIINGLIVNVIWLLVFESQQHTVFHRGHPSNSTLHQRMDENWCFQRVINGMAIGLFKPLLIVNRLIVLWLLAFLSQQHPVFIVNGIVNRLILYRLIVSGLIVNQQIVNMFIVNVIWPSAFESHQHQASLIWPLACSTQQNPALIVNRLIDNGYTVNN